MNSRPRGRAAPKAGHWERSRIFVAGVVLGGAAHAAGATAQPAEALPRVEVTGSQLRRSVTDAGLPLQVMGRSELERSGATSVAELLQRLPVAQGHQALAESVGNDGNGITSISLHNLGARYTLVLLNGQRMASSDGGSVVDLGTLPLAALERIEILADGASAVYGADAIGGVVNLILRQGQTPLFVNTRLTAPQGPGGGGWQLALGQGLGDLVRDGYALTWVASHDRARTLRAADRSVSASGLIRFRDPSGRDLLFFNGSMRSVPANVAVDYTDAAGDAQSVYLNPGLQARGQCPGGHLDAGGLCYFDYAATVVDQPQVERGSLMASGVLRLGASGFDWRGDALLARSRTRVTVAPYPADVSVPVDSAAFLRHVQPWLTDEQRAGLSGATAYYRLQDMGGRVVDYTNDALHLSTGVEGDTGGWHLRSAVTWSAREQRQDLGSGWLLGEPFMAALADGRIDPFAAPGQQSAAGLSALAGAGVRGRHDTTRSDLLGAELRATTEPFTLPGGPAQWGVGGEWRRTLWRRTVSDVARSGALLSGDPQHAHDVRRDTLGAYTELLLPFTPALSLTGALRHDHLGAARDRLQGRWVGRSADQFTAQLGGRWQVRPDLLWRASAGTGFRAPDLLQITRTQEDYGVTAGAYACPFTAANGLADHPYAALCWPGSSQVEAVKGGNAALRPERSRQWSLGGAFEPSRTVSVGADLWSVQVRDAVQEVSERLILADPLRYAAFYTTKYKASTGADALAVRLSPVNIGRIEAQGIDWRAAWRHGSPVGRWTQQVQGTWLLRSRYTVPGDDTRWASSLNRFGVDDRVAFRHILALSSTLERGPWTHQARLHWRNGYADQPQGEADCAVTTPDGLTCVAVQRRVSAHWTLDWTSTWRPTPTAEVSLGLVNVFNRRPPLTLRTVGAHMLGYDPRYASAEGRTLQVGVNWRF